MLRRRPRPAAVALLALVCLGASGCSGDDGTPSGATASEDTSPSSKILRPGRPGQGNETLDPDTRLAVNAANDADEAFMQMMVPHHAQAVQMSALARTRSKDPGVQAIARRILSAQGPEIQTMTAWLESRDLDVPTTMEEVPGHAGHDMDHSDGAAAMMGMLTEDELEELEAARGEEFDRQFLAGMIRHHQGAVDMAGEEMVDGSETLALELAAEVVAGQQAEIGRMQKIERQLQ